jgi:hypothetical protein
MVWLTGQRKNNDDLAFFTHLIYKLRFRFSGVRAPLPQLRDGLAHRTTQKQRRLGKFSTHFILKLRLRFSAVRAPLPQTRGIVWFH